MPANDSNLNTDLRRAEELIHGLCDERLTSHEVAELETLAFRHQEVRGLYVRLMHLNAGLYQYASALGDLSAADADFDAPETDHLRVGESMVLPAMKEPLEFYEEPILRGPELSVRPPQSSWRVPYYWMGGLAAIIAIGIGLLLYDIHQTAPSRLADVTPPTAGVNPRPAPITHVAPDPVIPEVVATVDVTINAVWNSLDSQPAGGAVTAGQSLSLKSGAAQFLLRHGGRLVAEGPVDLQVVSTQEILLRRGKLVAMVPGGGMTIRCPTGSVTDLGTEFGLAVSSDGTTQVSVFQGRVMAALSSTSTTQSSKQTVLNVGEAATISEKELTPNAQGVDPQQFIRKLKNDQIASLDVTDLISGGDGTTRRRGIAIDQITGAVGMTSPTTQRAGTGTYQKVVGHPFIDGVFVPGPTEGPTVVDSAGHTFAFPATTNQTYNYIWTGGKIPWPDKEGISTAIGGIDYATDDHAIICAHSNNAVTFDLNVVRRLYPDRAITRFHCKFANSYINGWFGSAAVNPVASAFILVDGASRFEKQRFTNQDGGTIVDLPISKTDRFLTLVNTDAGVSIDHNWIVWADPKFSVAAAN